MRAAGEARLAEFQLANRAFDLFTLEEREQALIEFARLQYPSIADRFLDAVSAVIERKSALSGASARGKE